jgi:hypothetical protein
MPYSATDLISAPRITHVLKMTDNEVRKLQVSGFYRDVELTNGSDEDKQRGQEEGRRAAGHVTLFVHGRCPHSARDAR